jgi:hypothetical protein
VVYLAAGIDAGMFSYAYPYQRRLLARAMQVASAKQFPISVIAPMCVQSTFFEQKQGSGKRMIVHLFNGINTTANHGLPAVDVPLREESVPIHGIVVTFGQNAPTSIRMEPGGKECQVRRERENTVAEVPPLGLHAMLIAE